MSCLTITSAASETFTALEKKGELMSFLEGGSAILLFDGTLINQRGSTARATIHSVITPGHAGNRRKFRSQTSDNMEG